MKLLSGFDACEEYQGGFVSIGNFDGVHRGHKKIITTMVEKAHAQSLPAVVLTFNPHPIKLLRPNDAPPSLSTLTRKAELLQACGVDCTIAYPTNRSFLSLSPREFFDQIIVREFAARGLVEGPNFFFGHDRAGDVRILEQWCVTSGMTLDVVEPVRVDDRIVSSSRVRSLVADGLIAEALRCLGHAYRIHGTVGRGAGRGRTLGFPTANLVQMTTLIPREGVYAGVAHHAGGRYPAAVHVGPNPTFSEMRSKIEVHLIGFAGDLYDQPLDVDLFDRLRDITPFDDVDALLRQVTIDIETVRSLTADQCKSHTCDNRNDI